MGRIELIASWLLAFLTASVFAQDDPRKFAAEEVDRHLRQVSLTDKLDYSIEVGIDPSIGGGGDGFAISTDHQRIKIIGSSNNAALQGAYYLLDMVGYRFLAPELAHYKGSGTIQPQKKDFDLKIDKPIVRNAKLKFCKLYIEEGHSHDIDNLKQIVEWMPKVGYNTLVIPADYNGSGRVKWDNWRKELTPELQKRGITIEVGGHGYQNFLNAGMEDGKLFEQHPDWFGQDANGKRRKEKSYVFCTSNSEAVEYLVKNFLTYVKDRPEIQIYDFWPPDGAKWCECDKCAALGAPQDRQAILLGRVLEKVKPVRPDLRLEMIAYSSYLNPPAKVQVDKGVLVDFCPINQQFDAQINDPGAGKNSPYVDALSAWRKSFAGEISIYSYYRKYAWDSLPVVIPHYMQKDLQWYAAVPVQGVSTYAEPGDWATYELNHYVLAALAWDPNVDVDALVRKFCEARYGSEATLAQAVLEMLGKDVRAFGSIPHTPLKDAGAIAAAQVRLQEQADRVRAAEERATDKSIKLSLYRLDLMCTYAAGDLEIQRLRATGARIETIKAKATELHEWVTDHASDGAFLTNKQRLNLNRMLSRYGVGEKKKPAAVE